MPTQFNRVGIFLFSPLLLLLLSVSCTGDMDDIERFEQKTLPEQEIRTAHIRRSEQGRIQVEIDAPYIARYGKPNAYTVYPRGVDLRFYDTYRQLKTTIHANRAVSYDDRNIMKAYDSVVVVDFSNGDTVYLEDLIWRDDDDIVFSNRPVRAVNGNRVTHGDGFVSDEQMANLRITHQRGIIEFNDE